MEKTIWIDGKNTAKIQHLDNVTGLVIRAGLKQCYALPFYSLPETPFLYIYMHPLLL